MARKENIMRKYNPALEYMVQNYRDEAKAVGISTAVYTNEEIFAIIEYWLLGDSEEQLAAVLTDLKEGVKR
jgi:hypothetical protein